jgi:hypothetical protein
MCNDFQGDWWAGVSCVWEANNPTQARKQMKEVILVGQWMCVNGATMITKGTDGRIPVSGWQMTQSQQKTKNSTATTIHIAKLTSYPRKLRKIRTKEKPEYACYWYYYSTAFSYWEGHSFFFLESPNLYERIALTGRMRSTTLQGDSFWQSRFSLGAPITS